MKGSPFWGFLIDKVYRAEYDEYGRMRRDGGMRMDRPYITTAEAAAKLNRHQTLIRKWCRQGRIAGAMKVGRDWVVPADVVKPTTGRAGRKWKPENLEKKLAPIVEKMITDSMRKS